MKNTHKVRNYISNQMQKHPYVAFTVGITLGPLILAGTVVELTNVAHTGKWTPSNQMEVRRTRNIEEKQRADRYRELYPIFLTHADRDKNGYIDFGEQVNAWRRTGLEGPFFEARGNSRYPYQFPKPTLEGLEKAVKSYETE